MEYTEFGLAPKKAAYVPTNGMYRIWYGHTVSYLSWEVCMIKVVMASPPT